MKLIIELPNEVKDAFDNASNEDINFSYYDYNSVIGKAIKNGTPLDDIKAEIETEKESMIQHNGTSDLGLALEIIDKHIGKENE